MRDQDRGEIFIPSDGHAMPPEVDNPSELELHIAFGDLARADYEAERSEMGSVRRRGRSRGGRIGLGFWRRWAD